MDTDNTLAELQEQIQEAVARCNTHLEFSTHYPPVPPFEGNLQGDLT